MRRYGCIARDDQPAALRARDLLDPGFNAAFVQRANRKDIDPQCSGDRLNNRELTYPGSNRGVPNDARADNCGCHLLEYFQPLTAEAVVKLRESRDVATGMREALNQSSAYGINGANEYDRDSAGRLQHWSRRCTTGGDDNIRSSGKQVVNMFADIGCVGASSMNINSQVPALDPAKAS